MIDQLVDIIKNWLVDQRLVVVVGPPGCGKSYSIGEAAKKLGMNVVEIDADDVSTKTLRMIKLKPLNPCVYVIDGVESIQLLNRLVGEYPNPTFATTTDYVLASKVENRCRVIKMFRPRIVELKRLAEETGRKLGAKVNYEALSTGDYRQALLSVYGSQGYEQGVGRLKELSEMMRKGSYSDLGAKDLIVLLDSAPSNFYGIDLVLFVKAVAVADRCKRDIVLNGFKTENPKLYPSYFLEKLRMVR